MDQEQKKGFTNQEIQAIEAERQDVKTWNVIHLLKDGKLFFRPEFLSIAPFDKKMTKMEKPTGNLPPARYMRKGLRRNKSSLTFLKQQHYEENSRYIE